MQEPAIENLDYLRQLIAEIRSSYDDMERLRMLYGTGMGTDSLQQGDR